MNRRQMLLAAGTVLTTGLAGCSAMGNEGEEPSGGTESPTVEARNGRSVVVTNTGQTSGEPDLAVLEVAVEARGDSAGAVRDDLSTRSDALREALLDQGLDEDAVTTQRFDIHERLDRRQMEADGVRPDSPDAREEYVYYEGRHAFTVELSDIESVGSIIDTAVDAGADDVGRVTYTLSDEKRGELREEALRTAIGDARTEAETIADEVGAGIVEATVVDASGGDVTPVHREVAYAGDGAADTPTEAPPTRLESGDVTVRASVRIEYEME